MYFCIKGSIWTQGEVGCKNALNPTVVYSTDYSKAVVPLLVLLFVALWFILRGDLFYVLPCVILFLCFSVLLALRLPRLGKRECFSYVCSSCACLDLSVSSSSCVWEGLRFMIVALPGLFSYPSPLSPPPLSFFNLNPLYFIIHI